MLVLGRKLKERIYLNVKVGNEVVRVVVTVTDIEKSRAKLGFTAPENVEIMREELVPQHQRAPKD